MRNPASNPTNPKKQWIWYPPPGTGISLQLSPPMGPSFGQAPSLSLNPPSWQYYQQPFIAKREALADTSQVEILNVTETSSGIKFEYFNNQTEDQHPFSRVVGGVDAKPNSVPWQVSLQVVEQIESNLCGAPKNLSSHFCGGSIIGDKTILTASHCFSSS